MVHYVGFGRRDYAARPIPVYRRPYWEFEAVIDGACAPVFSNRTGELMANTLWIFPPDYPHGWTGAACEHCEIVVFHFDDVPWVLSRICPPDSSLCVEIPNRIRDRLAAEGLQLSEGLVHADPLLPLRARGLANDICLALLEANPGLVTVSGLGQTRARDVVDRAIAWYGEHLSEGVSLTHVADVVGYSVGHLRRLFLQVLERSPRDVFADLRSRRARYLLSNTDLPVQEVASACGYADITSFTRAFHDANGESPAGWRRAHNQGSPAR